MKSLGVALALHVGILAMAVNGALSHQVDPSKYGLPDVSIDPKQVSLSGVSAGGYAAVQIHVAFSKSFMGVGVIAGGPFYCAMDNLAYATGRCMADGKKIPLDQLIDITQSTYISGFIDNPEYMRNDRMWVFSAENDTVVNTEVVKKLETYYLHYVKGPSQVASVYDHSGEHGHPTLDYGTGCATLAKPFIYNCSYDASGALLQHIFDGQLTNPSTTAFSGKVYTFSQTAFLDGGWSHVWGLSKEGNVYVPPQCENGSKTCKLHVALHGCEMSVDDIGEDYVKHAGYNPWADANDIVLLFPQACSHSNALNPYGCFDWWGYTGTAYASNIGAQTLAIKRMVDVLEGNAPSGNHSSGWPHSM